MPAIDFNFGKMFGDFLSECRIEALFIRIDKIINPTTGEFLKEIENGFKLTDVICSLRGGVDPSGDIGIMEDAVLVFNAPDVLDSLKGKGRVEYIPERPKSVLIVWQIKTKNRMYWIYKEIKPVDHHIFIIKGFVEE